MVSPDRNYEEIINLSFCPGCISIYLKLRECCSLEQKILDARRTIGTGGENGRIRHGKEWTIVRFRPGPPPHFRRLAIGQSAESKARAEPKASLSEARSKFYAIRPAQPCASHTQTREILFHDRRTCDIASYGTSWVYVVQVGYISTCNMYTPSVQKGG